MERGLKFSAFYDAMNQNLCPATQWMGSLANASSLDTQHRCQSTTNIGYNYFSISSQNLNFPNDTCDKIFIVKAGEMCITVCTLLYGFLAFWAWKILTGFLIWCRHAISEKENTTLTLIFETSLFLLLLLFYLMVKGMIIGIFFLFFFLNEQGCKKHT